MNLLQRIEDLEFKVKLLEEIIDSGGARKRCDNNDLNEIRHFIGMEE